MRNRMIIIIAFLVVCGIPDSVYGNDSIREIEDNLRNLTPENAYGYLSPLIRSIAGGAHRATFHTAEIKTELDIYIGMKSMLAFVPSQDKTFTAVSPIDGSHRQTATIVGDRGEDFLPDGFNWNIIPVMIPQIHFGNFLGTQLMFRYLPATKFDDKIGYLSVIGGGITHSISQYLPDFPLQFAVQGFYHQTTLGDIYEASGSAYNFLASTRFAGLTIYGGLGFETTDVAIQYHYRPQFTEPALAPTEPRYCEYNDTIDDRFRATIGLSMRFIIFNMNADYSFGNYQIATLGIGISI